MAKAARRLGPQPISRATPIPTNLPTLPTPPPPPYPTTPPSGVPVTCDRSSLQPGRRCAPCWTMSIPRLLLLCVCLLGLVVETGCRRRGADDGKDYDRALRPGERSLVEIAPGELPPFALVQTDREGLLQGIGHSLKYLATPTADKAYPVMGITKSEVVRGLQRFRELLQQNPNQAALNEALRREFRILQSVGWDGRGTVLFTGYYTPIFEASRTRTARFRYPLYKRPADFKPVGLHESLQVLPDGSTRPYPGRRALETSGALAGLELVWLAEPFDPYIIQVQGSAKLRMREGGVMEIGMHGTTGHQYFSIGKQMIRDGVFTDAELNLKNMRDYFRANPAKVTYYTHMNPRFVFFTETKGGPFGSLGQPVTADVSIATDKKIFPPGALTFVDTTLGAGSQARQYTGFRLDQDTGGAIQAPGRCDLYMGEGAGAEYRAGQQREEGHLYYILAR